MTLAQDLKAALMGKLQLAEYERVAMANWEAGYFCIDPLAEQMGGATGIFLTPAGRKKAVELRASAEQEGA